MGTCKLPDDLRYDLKKPCKDCPFLKATEFHEGILSDLPNFIPGLERGTVAHSCHKTDPRSDSPEGQKYKGPMQHCGGLLLMMKNDVSIMGHAQQKAWLLKEWKPEEMDKAPVWDSVQQMIMAYYKFAKKILKEKHE